MIYRDSLIVLVLTAVIMFSCSKSSDQNYTVSERNGIKYFSNRNIPSDPEAKIEPVLLFTITGDIGEADSPESFYYIVDIDIDNEGNIYLFDISSHSVKKFDENGAFVTSFGKRGIGPGEYPHAYDIVVQNGLVTVQSFTNLQMVKFDTDGNFIENVTYEGGPLSLGNALIPIPGNINMIGYKNDVEHRDGAIYVRNRLVIYDIDFNDIKTLWEYNEKIDPYSLDIFGFTVKYSAANNRIYIADNSMLSYNIAVFDYDGTRIKEIRFPYSRLSFNPDEEKYLRSKVNLVDGDTRIEQKKTYKRAVNDLFVDRYGRLLVRRSVERNEKNKNDFTVDIFKDGVYLNTTVIPGLIGEDMMSNFSNTVIFRGDRIYQVLTDEAKVNVYTY